MRIISRTEAKAAGLKRYFTGKPCKRGHVSERWVYNWVCVVCERVRAAARYTRNREKALARQAARYARNTDKVLACNAAWRARNPGMVNAKTAKRRARKLHATPAWADLGWLAVIYDEAQARGLTVDHIVPLQGRNVCGLHCPANLQLLTAAQNSAKGNRHV